MLWPIHEIALQQVVCHGGLDFDAREQRVEGRGDDLARAQCGSPDKDDSIAELVRGDVPVQDIHC
jgi:hypothetical protein